MRSLRPLLPIVAAIILFLGFQYVSIKQDVYRLEFPGAVAHLPQKCDQHNQANDKLGLDFDCACTMKAVPLIGFPFRDNANDACGQDDTVNWLIQSSNWILQLIACVVLYLFGRKLLQI